MSVLFTRPFVVLIRVWLLYFFVQCCFFGIWNNFSKTIHKNIKGFDISYDRCVPVFFPVIPLVYFLLIIFNS